jgi:hypothetical protein
MEVAMAAKNKKELFNIVLDRVRESSRRTGLSEAQAFGRWFAEMYFLEPQGMFISDGSHDGKVDVFFTTHNGRVVKHHILNTKYTEEYNKLAPPTFYQEIAYFVQAFQNTGQREAFLFKAVKEELRPRYRSLFEYFDDCAAELIFVTNCRRNDGYAAPLDGLPVKIFHLEDLIQHLIDDLDMTMPRTPDLNLSDIHMVLSPDQRDTSVSTSIVFARLVDFMDYMKSDPYDLLFARNVRVSFGIQPHSVNAEIRETFEKHPDEFAFSNNGITILCEHHTHNPGTKSLTLVNPRVVNGSQTLHSIYGISNPSRQGRVMTRIIEIPPVSGDDVSEQVETRRDILNKISVRSNRQNPIKKWDLVSNDDFQLEVYRLFRRRGWFYERRIREWNQRSRELRSVGINKGIDIKALTQYIVSYHWNNPKLGPALAKARAGELFEGGVYEQVQKTSAELAYQLFQASENIRVCLYDLSRYKYIKSIRPHISLALFALIVKCFQEVGIKWGSPELTKILDDHFNQWDGKRYTLWKRMIKKGIDHINNAYLGEVRQAKQLGDDIPTYANYFKNQTSILALLRTVLSTELKDAARKVVES